MSIGDVVNRIKVVLSSLIAMSVLGALATPTTAYPPGRKLTIALSNDMIDVANGKTNLSIANAIPGVITVSVANAAPVLIRQNGFHTETLSAKVLKLKTGINLVQVTSRLGHGLADEVASAKLYIPSVVAPTSGKISKPTVIKFLSVKPGSVVAVIPFIGTKKGKIFTSTIKFKNTSTTITLPARTFAKGKNNSYTVLIGPKIHLKFKYSGS